MARDWWPGRRQVDPRQQSRLRAQLPEATPRGVCQLEGLDAAEAFDVAAQIDQEAPFLAHVDPNASAGHLVIEPHAPRRAGQDDAVEGRKVEARRQHAHVHDASDQALAKRRQNSLPLAARRLGRDLGTGNPRRRQQIDHLGGLGAEAGEDQDMPGPAGADRVDSLLHEPQRLVVLLERGLVEVHARRVAGDEGRIVVMIDLVGQRAPEALSGEIPDLRHVGDRAENPRPRPREDAALDDLLAGGVVGVAAHPIGRGRRAHNRHAQSGQKLLVRAAAGIEQMTLVDDDPFEIREPRLMPHDRTDRGEGDPSQVLASAGGAPYADVPKSERLGLGLVLLQDLRGRLEDEAFALQALKEQGDDEGLARTRRQNEDRVLAGGQRPSTRGDGPLLVITRRIGQRGQ